jgi:glycosyltransferase involved in cell wall biosynthesis
MDVPVSVIIPCYRCAKTIPRAIDSVAKQTLRPAQVILVDDGSGDETLETLYSLQATYGSNWINVIPLDTNQGVSFARNVAWDQATQEYIAFLDADDVWYPQKIEIQYRLMLENPDLSGIGHRYKIVDPGTHTPELSVMPNPASHPITRNRLLHSNPFVTPSVMLKRNLAYRFDPRRRYCEDHYLWLELACDGLPLAFIDTTLVNVYKRIGASGASRHLLKMRLGDISNYWTLWRMGKLGFLRMCTSIIYSMLKFILMLIVGPHAHFAIKQRIDFSGSR